MCKVCARSTASHLQRLLPGRQAADARHDAVQVRGLRARHAQQLLEQHLFGARPAVASEIQPAGRALGHLSYQHRHTAAECWLADAAQGCEEAETGLAPHQPVRIARARTRRSGERLEQDHTPQGWSSLRSRSAVPAALPLARRSEAPMGAAAVEMPRHCQAGSPHLTSSS